MRLASGSIRVGLIILSVFTLSLMTAHSANASITPSEKRLLAQIDDSRMVQTIDRLCADDFAGRRAGTPEENKARDYLVGRFMEAGLRPFPGMSDYLQPLTMRFSLIDSSDEIKATLKYKVGSTWKTRVFPYPEFRGHGGMSVSSAVVFVGYGITASEAGYDDYKGLDVRGKIVMWLPGQQAGKKLSSKATGDQKMLNAFQHGAVACLMYKPASIHDDWGTNAGFSGDISDFPYLAVDETVGRDLLRPAGIDPNALLYASRSVRSGLIGAEVNLSITPICDPNRPTFNVIGSIPGSDPSVKDQVVMVGAHYDHLGESAQGVFRGADDNASGTSVLLETARAIHEAGLRPRRTMVFCSWTAEEAGLVGSNYFVAHPLFPLTRIVSNIEMDMVGNGTPRLVETTGARAFPLHYKSISSSAADLGIRLEPDICVGASDHLAFTRKNVPSSLLYTGGLHPHYHTIGDTPDGINPRVLDGAASLAALSAWRAAN